MIKHTQVDGVRKDSYASTRPTMFCDSAGCKNRVDGNAGGNEEQVKDRAMSLGWRQAPANGKHSCTTCTDKQMKAAKK